MKLSTVATLIGLVSAVILMGMIVLFASHGRDTASWAANCQASGGYVGKNADNQYVCVNDER